MNSFIGNWTDHSNVTVTITERNNILTVKYGNGRGPFPGHEIDELPQPACGVDFSDDAPFTGVLSPDGKTIYWSNGTKWTKH
ncbi:hypothetical protein [Mucilaginibacter paludis]|uniref:Uncharacterized protein n=1 Tax=Mucilaginibacter paludis DSM 18603 TaxID=714943 RepID=H1Y8D3_9SPHI|nr:hypothetical protein [Mucilaginibacter paludis]EHQ24952.1 hypothetical protein Mucpa_0771 [Mucilaginibacter paludis DSM 18603]